MKAHRPRRHRAIRLCVLALLAAPLTLPWDIAQAAGGGASAVATGPMALDAFVVSVIQRGRLRGSLTVRASLAVADNAGRGAVADSMPVLRDRIAFELTGYAGESLDVRKPADIDAVRERVQQGIDAVLGAGAAEVLIESVTIQRAR